MFGITILRTRVGLQYTAQSCLLHSARVTNLQDYGYYINETRTKRRFIIRPTSTTLAEH